MMYRVAEGRAIQHNGTVYGPGDVLPFDPSDALIADGSCVASRAPEPPALPSEPPAPAPAPSKPAKRRTRRKKRT